MTASLASPATFGELLGDFRRRIRRYVALEGAARVAAALGGAFWLSLALDYSFEPPRAMRGLLLAAATAAALFVATRFLVLRLARRLRRRELALVLERRFPQLNDRLITTVEAEESGEAAGPLTSAMLRQAAAEAAELSRDLPLNEVFDRRPLARAGALALVLTASIIAYGAARAEVLGTWFRRNLLLADEYYRRDTDLQVVVLADPGERAMEFRAEPVNGTTHLVYRHPRGADFTFLATVAEGLVVPEQVQFSFRNVDHSGRGGDTMTRIGDRRFRQRIAGLHDSIWLRLSGGDYATREPYLVRVVDPPQIDRITLDCLYPDYTGLNLYDEPSGGPIRQSVPVLGAQIALPNGTDAVLHALVNKPLRAVRVQTESWELQITHDETRWARRSNDGRAAETGDLRLGGSWLADDHRGFRLPLKLGRFPAADDPAAGVPLALSADSLLRFTLHDADDIIGAEPGRLTLNIIPDEPPRVEVRPRGIGSSVTRQATIPVVGDIQDARDGSQRYGVTDDYGVVDARFEYQVAREGGRANDSAWQKAPLISRPDGRKQVPVAERFTLLPLDLTPGARLMLKVVAVDGDHLTGPHIASGRTFQFLIVSDDELLAQVSAKELNLRRRFEQIIEEVKNTRKDLSLARTRLDEAGRARGGPREAAGEIESAGEFTTAAMAALTTAERAIGGIRKNANETQSIEEEFRDIREELENNAIPDVQRMLARLEDGIISPLHSINTVDYNGLDDALVLLLRTLEGGAQPDSEFREVIERASVTIEHLEAVLAQMLKLETVNEALQMLRDIIKAQEELQERTRSERKKKLIEGLQ